MAKVIVRQAQYDYEPLKQHIYYMLDQFGGAGIKKGSTVLIKPNLLGPAQPEAAMVTHPLVVKAAVEYVLQRGALPQISDSPAMGSFEKALVVSGIREALRGYDVVFREFKESETVSVGEPFNRIEVARDALEVPFTINLPKLKSHTQMMLTLGVKNMYGCIVGLRKPEWHFRTGINRYLFAKLLVQIYTVVRPSVTILDGILGMEGQGPGKGGSPRELGVLMGSSDAVSLDISVCRMLGIDPFALLTNRAARDMGLAEGPIDIDGTMPEIRDFKFPEITPLVFGPRFLHGFMRRHLVQRPVCDDAACRSCGECWQYCPAKAIERRHKHLHFDYDKCIRCYCCIEVCPHAALRAEEPFLAGTIKKVLRHDL
ncbi:MAG: DUF362 domain-containing protein [Nitrospirae bacterium]|nr:MAG: DUF362 domain-containing protein [Nitrospirota bacterium]